MRTISLFSAAVFSALLIALPVSAQTENPAEPAVSSCNASAAPTITVKLRTDLTETVASAAVGVYADITNAGTDDAFDGSVFVRASLMTDGEPTIIDEFVALENLDIAVGEATSTSFVWRTPSNAPKGAYQLDAFYIYPNAPFVPEVGRDFENAGFLTIAVGSDVSDFAYFKNGSFTVGGGDSADTKAPYEFSAGAVRIPVSGTVVNDSDAPLNGTITWRLYERGLSPLAEPIDVRTQDLKLHPHTSGATGYTIENPAAKTYYLTAEISDGTQQSRTGIFLSEKGVCPSAMEDFLGGNRSSAITVIAIIALIVTGGIVWEVWRKKSLTV